MERGIILCGLACRVQRLGPTESAENLKIHDQVRSSLLHNTAMDDSGLKYTETGEGSDSLVPRFHCPACFFLHLEKHG